MVGKFKARIVAACLAVPPPVTHCCYAACSVFSWDFVHVYVYMYVYMYIHIYIYIYLFLLEHRLNDMTVIYILSRAPSSLGPVPCGHIYTVEHMSERKEIKYIQDLNSGIKTYVL